MAAAESTCWSVIQGAAIGSKKDREAFAGHYAPVIRAYLTARWRGTGRRDDVDDAVQEVFLECFRQGGALAKADSSRSGGFRAFLYGIVRNVALRIEAQRAKEKKRRAGEPVELDDLPQDDERLSRVFDLAWARALLREAAALQEEQSRGEGEVAQKRVQLLRLRFYDGLPLREIARLWQIDPAQVHLEYAKARVEFKRALATVVGFHHPSSTPGEVGRECEKLLHLFD
jgi:RNA polymerase sigma-70 factor (ECF subfamily)